MKIIIEDKKNTLFLLFVFGLLCFWAISVKAQTVDCEPLDEAGCDAPAAQPYCEWCALRGGIPLCHKRLETNWPPSPAGTKLSRCSTLTDLVKYFYEWSLAIGGVLTFFSLIVGGVFYLSSAGNPGALNEAKDRIFSAILGLLLLLGSWLILNLINPELTNFRTSPPNLAVTSVYECDTNKDCIELYTKPTDSESSGSESIISYVCSEDISTQDDGKKQGICTPKTNKEQPELHAVVFSDMDYSRAGTVKTAQPNKSISISAKSVITYRWNNKVLLDANGNIISTCSDMCSQCPEPACNLRFLSQGNPCHWDEFDGRCYEICGSTPNACNAVLQLFGATGADSECSEPINTTSARDYNLTRWADKPIQCVRLIPPSTLSSGG